MNDSAFLQGLSDLGRRHGVGLTGQMQLYVLDRDDQQFDYTYDAEGFVRLGSSRDANGDAGPRPRWDAQCRLNADAEPNVSQ